MFNTFQFWSDIGWLAVEAVFGKRLLARYEAKLLVKQKGPQALEVARQVAELARQRGDKRAAKLWDEVARQVARREAARSR
ncbi:hypothetical protein [Bosea sp. 685]|uniref:hypothetical protein n=1 Tax=Bosea sp. 685 TaxID=3080057 RepID=UPI002892CFA9|nr:hypothetical protein [Bosea sp. 685]WNJ91774.1 hypothetical protein RMR04_05560 [Bosea sp. 685]